MKEFMLLFLWFVSGIAAKHEVHLVPAHILCPNVSKDHDILLPDPHDCSVYYRCENGLAIPQSCPIGLEWCKILSECTLPILANCTIKHTVVTYSPEELATYKPSSTPKPPGTPSTIYDICLINGAKIPDYFDCKSYYECKKNTPTKKHCPAKKSYSCWYGSCVDQKQADCILEGSQEGKKCAKNGAKLGHPDDCTKYYECENKKVVTKSCDSGLEFNAWFLKCYEPNLAYCHRGTTINPTTPTIGTTPTPSPTNDICPIPGATLPDPLNCNSYYQCENDIPVLYECPLGLEYSCWDQECLSPVISECANSIQENDTCTGNGTKLANPDKCDTYFECEDGVIKQKNCNHTLEYNQWFKLCLHPDLAHCKTNPNTTTTEKATSTPPPSPTDNICPIDGAKLPNPQKCNSYYQCKDETPYIQYCPDGYEYSCWDQECLPDESANCFSQNNQTGQPCNHNGDKLPNPDYCGSFYQCIDGKIEIQYCENDFEYNQWYKSCMKPTLAHCNTNGSEPGTSPGASSSTEPESTTTTGSTGTDHTGYSTSTGPSSSTEPESTSSSGSNPTVTEPSTFTSSESELPTTTIGPSSTEIICPHNDVTLPNPTSCNLFYQCVNGTQTVKQCNTSEEFSSWLGQCVDTNTAICINEGSIEGELCSVNGEKLQYPQNCGKYYECVNNSAVLKSCPIGEEFNIWFGACYDPKFAHCHNYPVIQTTSSTEGTAITISPIINICTENGSLLPNLLDCRSYYECENNTPIEKMCPENLYYSCWDLQCLPKSLAHCFNDFNITDKCSDGDRIPNPNNCYSYYDCINGKAKLHHCNKGLEYNAWNKTCVDPSVSHCVSNNTDTTTTSTTGKPSSTPPPSSSQDICPIEGSKLPNLQDCGSYYQCHNNKAELKNCTSGYIYSCWDQVCLPALTANCLNKDAEEGQACPTEGEKLPNAKNCSTFYQCVSRKVQLMYCEPGLEFNSWYQNCTSTSLAWCHTYPPIGSSSPETTNSGPTESTSSTLSSYISPSPIFNICPINGATLPNELNCKSYYECQDQLPVPKQCPSNLAYDCWEQKCTAEEAATCINQGNQTGHSCSNNGGKLPNINSCTSYYQCVNGMVHIKFCAHGQFFNQWFGICVENKLAHCQTNSSAHTTPEDSTGGTTITPSTEYDICPIDNALLPNPIDCLTYYRCEKNSPVLQTCELGFAYSCWDQKCVPAADADCIAEGSQQGKNCSKAGQRLQHIEDCNKYYECKNGKVITKQCLPGTRFNKWFGICLPKSLAHCETHTTLPSPTTTSHPLTTLTPSPTHDICPINGSLLPNPGNCSSYYICENGNPTIHYCDKDLEYSCWDQVCLPPSKANCIAVGSQTGKNCSKEGQKTQNPDNCHTYYQCVNGNVEMKFCPSNWYYNKWFRICLPSLLLSHCKIDPTSSTPTTITTKTTAAPSESVDICPIEGALLPAPMNCNAYYKCVNQSALIQHCPTNEEYSCWDQTCKPATEAECINSGDQVGKKCSKEGEKLQDPATCSSYYQCLNGVVERQYCFLGFRYNKWYGHCVLFFLSHCEINSPSTKPTTEHTITTSGSENTPGPSPIKDICPMENALLPNPANCSTYYRCQNNTPILQLCANGLEYSCWDQTCLPSEKANCIAVGSQTGKKCSKNGERMQNPENCHSYYQCSNGIVVTKMCSLNWYYNKWFRTCLPTLLLAHCTINKPVPSTIAPTTKSPQADKDICPSEGSLQPDPKDCKGYYKCKSNTAVKQQCPAEQEYSCWDQTCLPTKDAHCIAEGSQEGLNCSREGERLQNIENCYSYFECCKGKVVKRYCAPLLQYNKWYSECKIPKYAHCQTFSTKPTTTTTTTTTKTSTNTTPYKPPTTVVCQTNGAKVPNPKNCKQYFVCDKGSPALYECPPGYSYDCWNEACNPTSIARCVSAKNAYVGDKCTQNGQTIPNVSNCDKYYECVNGKVKQKKCGFLQEYNVWENKCTSIVLAKCANNAFLGII